MTAVNGVATFSNLSINYPWTGYTLAASATGLTGLTSSAFNVIGAATQLKFTVQPSNVAAGASIAAAVVVSVEDAGGNIVTTGAAATSQITIAIGTNPSAGTLSGDGADECCRRGGHVLHPEYQQGRDRLHADGHRNRPHYCNKQCV